MHPEFPKARQQMLEMWDKALVSAIYNSDPLLTQISIRAQKEGKMAFVDGSEMKYENLSSTYYLEARHAEGMSPEEFFGMATKLGKEIGAQQVKGLFKVMLEPSPNAMPVQWNSPIDFGMFLETWEKMEVDFGKDGMPRWPTAFLTQQVHEEVNSNFPKWLEDPVNKEKLSELTKRKRKEFDEREARRRLVE